MQPVGQPTIPFVLPSVEPGGRVPVADDGEHGFAAALSRAGAALVDHESAAAHAVDTFASGAQGNLHETLLAVDKADISLKLMVTVRNRLLDAYRELMRMGA